MSEIHTSAPGKLMLCGEYAVLLGAPALMLAVNREVMVRIRSSDCPAGRFWAQPLMQHALEFDPTRAECWLDVEQAGSTLGMTSRLLPLLIRHLAPAPRSAVPDIEVDSRALFDRDNNGQSIKLGLGSSAATAVALFRALAGFYAHSIIYQTRQQQLDWLLPLYRSALQSSASGADLAASLFGGVIAVRAQAERLLVHRQQWPETLRWKAIWTLKAAQTTDFVGRFERWRRAHADADQYLAPLMAAAEQALVAFEAQNALQLIESLQQYAQALATMDTAIQAGSDHNAATIITPDHRVLTDLAAVQGVPYKSCGAGGGDLGIALSQDAERLGALVEGLSPIRARPLELQIAPVLE